MPSTTVALHEENNIQPRIFSNTQYYYPEKTDQLKFGYVTNQDVKYQSIKNALTNSNALNRRADA